MPYSEKDIKRVEELHALIVANREHEHAAPTYKDSPALREMTEIVLSNKSLDNDSLEDKIGMLGYLADAYCSLCRPVIAADLYIEALRAHNQFMEIKEYDEAELEAYESVYYMAVKCRTYYTRKDYSDITALVKGHLPDGRIEESAKGALDTAKWRPKYDPVEETPEYLAVIDEVEKAIDERKTLDFCMEYWSLKSDELAKHGIYWRSPVLLNPGMMFD